MLWAILNKSWRQHPTKQQLYGHLPPITKIIQIRQTRHTGHCWRSRDNLISDVLLWTPTYGQAKAGQQLEHTYSGYVRIQDVALRTCQKRWSIGRSGERESGISVLAARHDDEDHHKYKKDNKKHFNIVQIWLSINHMSTSLRSPSTMVSQLNLFICICHKHKKDN